MSLRLATSDDGGKIRRFIDQHWKRGHILARDEAFFDWQHRSREGVGLHFVIAEQDEELTAILGWIPTSLYDGAVSPEHDVLWLTTWKVDPEAGSSGLGLAVLSFLKRTVPHAAIATVGASAKTLPLYKALGYEVGSLRQHFLIREGLSHSDLRLIRLDPSQDAAPTGVQPGDLALRPIDDELTQPAWRQKLDSLERCQPEKTTAYFSARYLRHPLYRYHLYAVERRGELAGLLAARLCQHDGAAALRLVDFLGPFDGLARGHGALQGLLAEHGAEYLDFYEIGLDLGALESSGLRQPRGEGVVPNYFEPFVASNIPLHFAFKGPAYKSSANQRPAPPKGAPFCIFKGDGDQDRPT